MEIGEILNIALPVVYVLVGAALIWLVIEIVLTLKKTRTTVDTLQKQLEPTLQSVERITASLEPTVAKVDPLVERVSLTVDAANLEIMRVDKILEDVSDVTGAASSVVQAVDDVTSAPLDLVNSVTTRIRSALKPHRASGEAVRLGQKKAELKNEAQENAQAKPKHIKIETFEQEKPDHQASAASNAPYQETAAPKSAYVPAGVSADEVIGKHQAQATPTVAEKIAAAEKTVSESESLQPELSGDAENDRMSKILQEAQGSLNRETDG